MAGNNKTPKAELIAIYRLEFYKKQKNWKLSSDAKRSASRHKPKQAKPNLNQTYEVETASESACAAPLNDAFLDTESDKNQSPTKEQYDAQCSHKPDIEDPPPEHIVVEPDLAWTQPEQMWQTEQRWCNPEEELSLKLPLSVRDYNRLTEAVWPQTAVWEQPDIPTQEYTQGLWSPDHVQVPLQETAYTPEDLVSTAEDWLRADQPWSPHWSTRVQQWASGEMWTDRDVPNHWMYDDKEYGSDVVSVDSVSEFMRGADAAPHSSELDLRPISSPYEDLSSSRLACMSSRQLRTSVREHALALRNLLQEAELRTNSTHDKLSHTSPFNNPHTHSYDEYPTRDIDPACTLRRENTFTKYRDVFVAGSYRNTQELVGLGRGRGRLRNERVIGIGKGRPYRL